MHLLSQLYRTQAEESRGKTGTQDQERQRKLRGYWRNLTYLKQRKRCCSSSLKNIIMSSVCRKGRGVKPTSFRWKSTLVVPSLRDATSMDPCHSETRSGTGTQKNVILKSRQCLCSTVQPPDRLMEGFVFHPKFKGELSLGWRVMY